jgi:hypothetical protein
VWKNDEGTLRKSPSLTTLNAYLIQNQTLACPSKGSWRGKVTILTQIKIFENATFVNLIIFSLQ